MRRVSIRLIVSAIALSVCFFVLIFIIINVNDHTEHLELPPYKCECPLVVEPGSKAEKLVVPKIEAPSISKMDTASNSTQTMPPLPICRPVDKSQPVQRAIIIYYPHHQSEYFFPEVRWLYRSWAEMLRDQPPTWRTDFLIFSYNLSIEFQRLGCVNHIRKTKDEPSVCRLFLYVPIQFRVKAVTENNYQHAFDHIRDFSKTTNQKIEEIVTLPKTNDPMIYDVRRSENLYTHLRTYGYIDSINTIFEGYKTFKMYDFVLRTDIDVFIYRHFGHYIPANCTLITGGGGYGTDFNRRKLRRIARDMDFAHVGLSGMGSTWYGSAYDGYLVANQTLNGMLWLAQYEFATPERESKLGTLMWPQWHYGVLLLYGQHLAINHLVGTNQIRIRIGSDLLDQSTTDATTPYVQQGTRLNLHCWHTDNRFSKFAFKMGHYKQAELEKYRNDTTAQAYAMRMALESKYMTLEHMASLVQNISTSS
ncbi:unnamed protein product [Rotaria socialis]|uniref:DUF7164 domain-containing protein n=1 Tax=Rotaria socialis TaxID=392032 RepID=A0A817Z4B1_9BILA|nr:unnamed protein product [Rotaria socialis]CAF3387858.1 unnamed protein product [Rotaria socialis]CAF4531280.1 unnamed protein product [Rotaria socialis]CAF4785307.1 unnamed protein product [Rotaria socialis]